MPDALATDAADAPAVRTRTDGAVANEIGVEPFASAATPRKISGAEAIRAI